MQHAKKRAQRGLYCKARRDVRPTDDELEELGQRSMKEAFHGLPRATPCVSTQQGCVRRFENFAHSHSNIGEGAQQ